MAKQSWNTLWSEIKKWERTGGWVRPLEKWWGRVDRVCSSWVCRWFHKKDHVCWDDLWRDVCREHPLPGIRCWYCNKCGRPWGMPNPHKFPSQLPEREPWGEYWYPENLIIISNRAPEWTVELFRKWREERDAESRTSTDESVSDPTGPNRPNTGGERTGKCGATTDGECSSSI